MGAARWCCTRRRWVRSNRVGAGVHCSLGVCAFIYQEGEGCIVADGAREVYIQLALLTLAIIPMLTLLVMMSSMVAALASKGWS